MSTTARHVKDSEVDLQMRELPAETTMGVSISANQMDMVRLAYLSDLDRRRYPAPSMARWILRAVEAYVLLEPEERAQRRATADERAMDGLKGAQSLLVYHGFRDWVQDAVQEERVAGRKVSASQLVREALMIAVEDARARAGGSLPVVVRG